MTATALYTLIAAGAVLGGYALFRRGEGPHAARGDFATGWDHTTVDYQNPADAVTDQRYERNFFNRPYEIFCPGGEIRPYEIDSHGQPTGRQLVMPGESPTVGDPAEYVMVGWQPSWGHHHHHHHHHLAERRRLEEQAALAEAEAEALALAAQDPMATMGDFATGALTPAQIAAIHAMQRRRFGGLGMGRQNSFQQQMLMQQMQQMQQQIDALTAQQQLADTSAQADLLAATATTGDYATGALYNPYALSMLRHRGWRQRQLQQQLLQQQLLEAQLAQQQAELLAAQQAVLPLDPDAAGLGAAAGV
jgi:hypothetical protein